MTIEEIEAFVKAALKANKELYNLIHRGFDESLCKKYDVGAGGDISSGIDILAEDIFVKHLSPFGTIYSEESGAIGEGKSRIILDPLDGSDNFLSRIPYYGSSVALETEGKVDAGIICNLANGEVFVKTENVFQVADIREERFHDVSKNSCSAVGIFERAYRSQNAAKKLFAAEVKYRIPGASALSFAYAHYVDFVIFEGDIREYDAKAGLFMCENLYKYEYNGLILICKDLKQFNNLKNILLEEQA